MSVDLPSVHTRCLDATRILVAEITADQWHNSTVDDPWDVRELLNHVVEGNHWAAELGKGRTIEEVGDRLDGDVLGDDPLSAYDVSAEVAAAVFREPGAMERPCAVSYGPVPGSVYCGHRIIDVLVHGWDLAMATDQNTKLDDDLVAACHEILAPQIDNLKSSGAFGGDVPIAPDADDQTRLLAMLGRVS